MRKVKVALVGLGFGAEFIPIYQAHPDAELVALCQRSEDKLAALKKAFGVTRGYSRYEDLLADPEVEAVHINTPIPDHAEQSILALKAGKHVACTVPMATSVDDCRRVVEAVRESGRVYMMMETVVFSREFLCVKELYDNGDLGRIQFLQATHQQDMDGWPDYWPGLPPMWYATHCVGPVLALTDAFAEAVSCIGSGRIRSELAARYNSPFAVESAHLTLRDSDVGARVARSLFDTARQYRESFDVYGSRRSFEWSLVEGESHVLHTAKRPEPEIPEKIDVPDYAHRLPESIRRFTTQGVYDCESATHLSFTQGSGHGGSHPHLVHEFIRAIVEERAPRPDALRAANWTCTGLCAHESALRGGERIGLPTFTLPS